MSDAFLTPQEVHRLTGNKRHKAQAARLKELGYRFILAGTGEPLVRWSDLDESGKPAQRRGHRWDRMGSVRQLRP